MPTKAGSEPARASKVLLRVAGATVVAGTTVVLESLQDPIELALHGKKFASITHDKVEANPA